MIQDLITKLNAKLALKQHGDLDYFLGLEVKKQQDGSLLLFEAKCIYELLEKAHIADANPINSPMISNSKISKFGTYSLSDSQLYRSIVDALLYATLTTPEISYSVNEVCQFMSHPFESHWKEVKCILRYLKGNLNFGLNLKLAPSFEKFSLLAYSNTDWETLQQKG